MKNIFALLILLAGGFFLLSKHGENLVLNSLQPDTLIVFFKKGCPHCEEASAFINKTVQKKYPRLQIQRLNVDNRKNLSKLITLAKKYHLKEEELMTPVLFLNGQVLVGWEKAYEKKLLSMISAVSAKKDLTRRQK